MVPNFHNFESSLLKDALWQGCLKLAMCFRRCWKGKRQTKFDQKSSLDLQLRWAKTHLTNWFIVKVKLVLLWWTTNSFEKELVYTRAYKRCLTNVVIDRKSQVKGFDISMLCLKNYNFRFKVLNHIGNAICNALQ